MAGIVSFPGGKPVELWELHRMKEALRHRGPDGSGVRLCGPAGRVGLAHSRLAVIDLLTGDQPMSNEDGTVWVTFNGEIYNFAELRGELEGKGHVFKTRCDTEVLVHLYEEMGSRCAEFLVGMFAFAIWDQNRGELLLARDRLGQKPLYWSVRDGRLYFASESQAILSLPEAVREVDPEALDYYLRLWYVPSPRSIWRGMQQLSPATTMTWRLARGERSVAEQTYWRPPASPGVAGDEEEVCEELRYLLGRAARERMMSDVSLGVFLSGGLDSTILVSILAETGGASLRTFSVGFPEAEYNELPLARQAAEHFGTDHSELMVEPAGLEDLEALVRIFDEPLGDSSSLPTHKLCRSARRSIVVALTGEAGDENFGGYLRYAPLVRTEHNYKHTDWWRSRLFGRLMGWGSHWRLTPLKHGLMYRLCRPEDLYFRLMGVFSDEAMAWLYTPEAAQRADGEGVRRWFTGLFEEGARHGVLGGAMYADLLSYLPHDLNTKLDRASMAVGLEARSPFEDHRLVEFACRLPARWKMRPEADGSVSGKYLLRKAFRGRIPDELLERPKRGFQLPLKAWFAGPWADFTRQVLLDASSVQRGLFRREAVRQLIDEHVSGRRDHGQRLWQLLFLEMWLRGHVDSPTRSQDGSDSRSVVLRSEAEGTAGEGAGEPDKVRSCG